MKKMFAITALVAVMSGPLVSAYAAEDVLEPALLEQARSDASAVSSQAKIDSFAEAVARDLQRYRTTSQRLESLEIYNLQLQKLIDSQQREIASIVRQTEEIESIETGALPLMIEMTSTLTDIVELDVPFLVAERERRIESLASLIDRADVTAGEKYRRIMEAYLVEVDYGRTIEAYRGELEMGGAVRTVDFLRIGRVGLYYQTLDGDESGQWNAQRKAFERLDDSSRRPIMVGLRVARKQSPPELLTLPINVPEV
ncbi:MAG: DUF3450 family protein [Proteobacteria bacterium]|nr:DUF3450 family protein [Pseudomonadota bacterium]